MCEAAWCAIVSTRSVVCSWDGSRLSDVPAITSRSNAHDSRAGAGRDLGFLRQPAWRIAPSIQAESCLRGLSTKEFAVRAADHICELNAIPPFREGNGRTRSEAHARCHRQRRWTAIVDIAPCPPWL